MKRVFLKSMICGLAMSAFSFAVNAQSNYPDKPIKLIVPWPVGGSADAIGRMIGIGLNNQLGKQVVVENIAGAGGNIATQAFVKAQPDGYTLLLATSSTNSANPNLYAKVPFDPIKDFVPVIEFTSVPSVLLVRADSPYKSAKDIVAAAKASPGKLSYGSGGNGNSGHLTGELFKSQAGIFVLHIPYKGNTPALMDVMGGQIDYMFNNGAINQIQGGKVRALGVTADKRLAAIPDVPTMKEAGYPGVSLSTWFGIAVPAGTPDAVVAKLNTALNNVLKTPEVIKSLSYMGAEPKGGSAAEFQATWKKDLTRYAEIIKVSGAKME
jgi:tripartite-type tricarboxylate transporter receptor subunit TctC